MKTLKSCFGLMPLIALSACGVNPEKLNAPVTASSIYLDADREAKETIPGAVTTYTLRKGIYESAKEDAKGTYYLGPESCFMVKIDVADAFHRTTTNCGIFVPSNANQPAVIFTVVGTQKVEKLSKQADQKNNATANIGTSPIAMAATNAAIKMELGQYELRIRKDDPLAKDLRSLVKQK
ncbi:hypothetical protein GCM10011613_31820 [Cellvibrio zantedeschiae]|uniref:Lipoprotein n=1 Tax=Cellvibrio zantedeschiae TaxID=1237077 RepID=A0ABQ3B8G5_9GAMM|nr:hypothetical protein [Cellvibrio zantedeschiae]GGY84513.1 hypothetical protein GCM10011613_31820 [Cellvibrio zantedeschiae]